MSCQDNGNLEWRVLHEGLARHCPTSSLCFWPITFLQVKQILSKLAISPTQSRWQITIALQSPENPHKYNRNKNKLLGHGGVTQKPVSLSLCTVTSEIYAAFIGTSLSVIFELGLYIAECTVRIHLRVILWSWQLNACQHEFWKGLFTWSSSTKEPLSHKTPELLSEL